MPGGCVVIQEWNRSLFGDTLYVTAAVLHIRAAPSTAAPIINALPYGTPLRAASVTGEELISGRRGQWYSISANAFVFGGYLSPVEPPHSDRLGLRLLARHANVICDSDISSFYETKYFLSSGELRLSASADHGCTSPHSESIAGRGSYRAFENGLEILIHSKRTQFGENECGDPGTPPPRDEIVDRKLRLHWHSSISAFIEEDIFAEFSARSDYRYSKIACAFVPLALSEQIAVQSICTAEADSTTSYEVIGAYCPQ